MEMKLLLVFLLIIPTFAICQQKPEPFYQNEKFVSTAFGIKTTVHGFIKKYGNSFHVTKKPVSNEHNPRLTDTIYIFQKGNCKIEIYHSQSADFVQSAMITSPLIDIGSGIKIGQTKKEVITRLKLKTTPNKFQVGDLESGSLYSFEFIQDTLNSVEFEGYVD